MEVDVWKGESSSHGPQGQCGGSWDGPEDSVFAAGWSLPCSVHPQGQGCDLPLWALCLGCQLYWVTQRPPPTLLPSVGSGPRWE